MRKGGVLPPDRLRPFIRLIQRWVSPVTRCRFEPTSCESLESRAMALLADRRLQSKSNNWFRQDNPLAHIPGEDGWPIVGNTLTVLRDPIGAVDAMYQKYGPVFRSRVFGLRSLSLLGPEANELVLFD